MFSKGFVHRVVKSQDCVVKVSISFDEMSFLGPTFSFALIFVPELAGSFMAELVGSSIAELTGSFITELKRSFHYINFDSLLGYRYIDKHQNIIMLNASSFC